MENLKKLDKAGELLKNLPFFRNINESEAKNYTGMFQSWEYIVGVKLAGYSRIKDLDKNTLIVEADHPAIIQLLQIKYSQTLEKLNKKYGELKISDIRIQLKNPDIVYENNKRKFNMPGDTVILNDNKNENFDINTIENENFKNLLLKMKKRS